MARKSQSFGDELNSWKLCLSGHKSNAADFAFLKSEVTAFEQLLAKAEKENNGQESAKAALLAQTKLVNDIRKQGKAGYAALIRYAKAKYGPKSAKIKEFVSETEGVSRPRKQKQA
jgi:hypothetical protein